MIFRRRKQNPRSAEAIACDMVRRSDLFDSVWYLQEYPDVAEAGIDAAVHYIRHGATEGRNPGPWFNTSEYLAAGSDDIGDNNPLLHYLEHRGKFSKKNGEKKKKYSNFSEFLKYTALNPIISTPFNEEDRRCFSVMEAVATYLIENLHEDIGIKVSVIMPVRNREHTLHAAIDSVIAQRYTNFELIIIDDASEDTSVAVANSMSAIDQRIKVLALPNHMGVCAARNAGLAQATGDVVAYLDSDNSWLEDYLGTAVGTFQLLSEADAIYSGQYIYAESDTTKLTAVRFSPTNLSLLEQHNYIDLNCFVHRRSVLDMGIRFDEKLRRLVDWDFILRISDSYKIFSVPVLQCRYYLHAAENTITKTIPAESAVESIIADRADFYLNKRPQSNLIRKLCVVIPSYEALAFLKECIQSLHPYFEDEFFEIVIVDNNSSQEVRDYLRDLENKKVKVIFNEINYGFSYAVNQGANLATPAADIVILNNDARLGHNALQVLQQTAYKSDDVAISVPQQIVPPSSDDSTLHVPYANPALSCDVSLSAHHENIESIAVFHDGRQVDLCFAPFFCVYIKREIWNICGGLDYENGRHYRSDRIMCDFIRNVLGKRIVYTADARVHHALQISTNELSRNESNGDSDFRTMLIKNAWPTELMRELNITKRLWDIE